MVHENHGIGQYMGTVRLASEGTLPRFSAHPAIRAADKLYVPTDQLDRVQKYIGSEGEAPKLNRLSGGEWQRQKAKVKAVHPGHRPGELIKLYAAARVRARATPSTRTRPGSGSSRTSFPYEETPDQLAAIEDIKRDMESRQVDGPPAVRRRGLRQNGGGAARDLQGRDGRQAGGHARADDHPGAAALRHACCNRFDGFPVHVDTISRFRTRRRSRRRCCAGLKEGEVDVIVGTHRLLAKDVEFKDLGLLVVDEEQRFGVAHKESHQEDEKDAWTCSRFRPRPSRARCTCPWWASAT